MAAFVIGTTACNNEDREQVIGDEEVNMEVVAENLLAESDELTDEGIDLQLGELKSGNAGFMYLNDGCPVVTYDKESNPRKIVFDFGIGCEGKDGKMRSGKIIVTATAFENLSVERLKTFENFVVDGTAVAGTIKKKITLNKENVSRVAAINEEVTLTFDDGTVVTRKASLTREHFLHVIGLRADDESTTWGEAVTTRRNGVTITKTIAETTPLLYKSLCRQLVSGIVTFSNGSSTWTIDYGNGECDNEATVTRDGETRTVKINK